MKLSAHPNERRGPPAAPLLRAVQVGDLLPSSSIRTARARRLEATAFVLPGRGDLGRYLRTLEVRSEEFSAWDGRVVALARDGGADHRVIIVDRYGQVYDAVSATDAGSLPNADALEGMVQVPGDGVSRMRRDRRRAAP